LAFTETRYNSFLRTKKIADDGKFTKMWWTNDNNVGYTNLLECKEGLGPKIEQLKKAVKAG